MKTCLSCYEDKAPESGKQLCRACKEDMGE